jgi:hypothetical protein
LRRRGVNYGTPPGNYVKIRAEDKRFKIPSEAVIAEDKLTRYLLVPRPKNDKSKFLAQAGFTLAHPDVLETAVRDLIQREEALQDRSDEYGDFYIVEGDLIGPEGEALYVVTVWHVQPDLDNEFRFVTLKPGKKADDET